MNDWKEVILFCVIFCVLWLIMAIWLRIEKVIQDRKQNRKLFLSPEEREKLRNGINGRIDPDRNTRIMKSMEHDCEYDINTYDEDVHR